MSCNKKKKVLFTTSIVLNVVLLGAVGGHFFHEMNRFDDPKHHKLFERFDLSSDTKTLVKNMLNTQKDDIHGIITEVLDSKKALEEIASAPEFDAAAYDAAAERVKEAGVYMCTHKMQSFKELLEILPQEERKKVVKMMMKFLLPLKHEGKPRGHHKRFPGDRKHTEPLMSHPPKGGDLPPPPSEGFPAE